MMEYELGLIKIQDRVWTWVDLVVGLSVGLENDSRCHAFPTGLAMAERIYVYINALATCSAITWQNDQSMPPTSTNIMKCNFLPYQHQASPYRLALCRGHFVKQNARPWGHYSGLEGQCNVNRKSQYCFKIIVFKHFIS